MQIIEVLRRSEQGATRPFICLGDDDEVYFVKGTNAGRPTQIREWIAGKLGLAFGLPIAPFVIVDVPEELIKQAADAPHLELEDLGVGPAFASLRQEGMEVTVPIVQSVPDKVRRDLLVFDWWIRNGDRLLTENGGNPNLLWDPGSSKLVVIDHNLAFDSDFDTRVFCKLHIFASCLPEVFGDVQQRREYSERFSDMLGDWPKIKDAIPEEWFFLNSEMITPVNFDMDEVYRILTSYQQSDFWGTP